LILAISYSCHALSSASVDASSESIKSKLKDHSGCEEVLKLKNDCLKNEKSQLLEFLFSKVVQMRVFIITCDEKSHILA
jgi:hypothetical protein